MKLNNNFLFILRFKTKKILLKDLISDVISDVCDNKIKWIMQIIKLPFEQGLNQ